jgi:predicted transcriptional regulator of viral defense system
MLSTVKEIERKAKSYKRGKIFFIDDFAALGTPDAIKKALQRLVHSGLLERLAKGIYLYPEKEREICGEKYAQSFHSSSCKCGVFDRRHGAKN